MKTNNFIKATFTDLFRATPYVGMFLPGELTVERETVVSPTISDFTVPRKDGKEIKIREYHGSIWRWEIAIPD